MAFTKALQHLHTSKASCCPSSPLAPLCLAQKDAGHRSHVHPVPAHPHIVSKPFLLGVPPELTHSPPVLVKRCVFVFPQTEGLAMPVTCLDCDFSCPAPGLRTTALTETGLPVNSFCMQSRLLFTLCLSQMYSGGGMLQGVPGLDVSSCFEQTTARPFSCLSLELSVLCLFLRLPRTRRCQLLLPAVFLQPPC